MRGRGRVNAEEAKAIAEMTKRCLTNWLALPKNAHLALGVVTFNVE